MNEDVDKAWILVKLLVTSASAVQPAQSGVSCRRQVLSVTLKVSILRRSFRTVAACEQHKQVLHLGS